MAAGDVWERVAGTWVQRATLSVGRAEQWWGGAGVPSAALGVDGDWYLDTSASVTPPALVSSLPASPIDGQEVYYLADATNGVVWHLRYRAASASAYKWEFVGGAPMQTIVSAGEGNGATLNTWMDLATVGPIVTVPRAGEYLAQFGAQLSVPAAVSTASTGIAVGATSPTVYNSVSSLGGNAGYSIANHWPQFITLAANDAVRMRYQANANQYVWTTRVLTLTPRRVS